MIHVPGVMVYIGLPRTFSELIEAALIREFPAAKVVYEVPDTLDPKVCSIRNPFSLVLEWFHVNPEHRNLLWFIRNYNHSHFVREGTLFWNYKPDYDVMRDERAAESLLEYCQLEIDLPEIEDYKEHFGPEEVAAMQERFANDLEQFEYSF